MDKNLDFKKLEALIFSKLKDSVKKEISHFNLSLEGTPEYLVVYLYFNNKDNNFSVKNDFKNNIWNDSSFFLKYDDSFKPAGISLESILISNSKMLDMQNAEKACIEYATLINSYYTD